MYAACTITSVLKRAHTPGDLIDLVLLSYSDADLNGDPMTTKSVTGWWVELYSVKSGRSFSLSWSCAKQASTGGSTAETETVAFSHVGKQEGIPIQMFLKEVLPRRIQAVTKGYSKRLRHLPRTQRVCVGMLHEILNDKDLMVTLAHCLTVDMKADIFTKVLNGLP